MLSNAENKMLDLIYETYLPHVPYKNNSLEKYHECMKYYAKKLGHEGLLHAVLPDDIGMCRKALMTLVPVFKFLHQSEIHSAAVAVALLYDEPTIDVTTAMDRLRQYRKEQLDKLFTVEKKSYLRYVPYYYALDNLNIDTTVVDHDLAKYAALTNIPIAQIKGFTEISVTPDDKDNLYKYYFQMLNDDHL